MEVEHGPDISALQSLLVISLAEECEHYPVGAERRLYDIGQVFLVGGIVKVGHILPRCVLML